MGDVDLTSLKQFLNPYPAEVQALTLALRGRMVELLAPVNEIHWDAMSAVCAGFTYTDHERDNFINLAVYANHVSLIFPWGVRLSDPEGRLNGTGNQVRHMRLPSLGSLDDAYLLNLIDQAKLGATRPAVPTEPLVIVKVMKGPKRRPTPSPGK